VETIRVPVDVATHASLMRVATDLGLSVGDTLALAVRTLRQQQIATDLQNDLGEDEVAWLDG
jgi:hypothetical protein